jgi:hypothetical protein
MSTARGSFNDEELYYMNKMANYLFNYKVDKLTYA